MRYSNKYSTVFTRLRLRTTLTSVIIILAGISAGLTMPVFAESKTVLEEIVVKARKRSESLQDTPIAVTTFGGEEIDARNMANISGISDATPNMTFNTTASNSGSSNAAVVFLRGVGQSDFYPHIDPGVGIYLDGVYVSRTTGGVFDTLEIEQIEVLRGPQGTLFGKNTIGGAINITSKRPEEEFSGSVDVTAGSYSRADVKVMMNVPLSENLLSRFTFSSLNRDGHIKSLLDGSEYGEIESLSARGMFAWQVSNDVSVDLGFDITSKNESSAGSTVIQIEPTGSSPFVHNNLVAPTLPGGATGTNLYDTQWITGDPFRTWADGSRSKSDLEQWGVNLAITWDINESMTFKSITAYRTADSDNDRDGDASPHVLLAPATRIDQKQFTQELQLSGRAFNDKLDWLLGAFYLREDILFAAPVDIAFVATNNNSDINNESYAVFAQSTYALTDVLNITAGIRQTRDEKGNETSVITRSNPGFAAVGAGVPVPVPPGVPLLIDDASETFNEFTYMASVDYSWTEDLMTYFSWSKGFKSGGFAQRIAFPRNESPSFGPEEVTSAELGAKWTGWDNRLRINAALFHADYKDLQVVVFNLIEPLNENAGDATIKGAELELSVVPVEGLTLSFGAGYTDASYDFLDPGTLIPNGSKLAYTPEFTANLSASYSVPIQWGEVSLRGDWSYRDDVYFDALNHDALHQPSYSLFNADISFVTNDDKWKVSLFATNLTDEEYIIGGFADLITSGFVDATYARPREFGASLSYRF